MKFTYLILVFLLATVSCKSEDPTIDTSSQLENKLIGTWKGYGTNDYWFQFTFNQDESGNRIDSELQEDNFTYTFTIDEVIFKTGFPNGRYYYERIDADRLLIFGDTLTKQ